MNRWISYLLLVSMVRLQLVCCCGSIAHLELGFASNAVEGHTCCDCAVSEECTPCDTEEIAIWDDFCLEQCHPFSNCDPKHSGPHQHHLLVWHAAMMPTSPQQSMKKILFTSLVPFVATTLGVWLRKPPLLTLAVMYLMFNSNSCILTLFGQLRI